MAHWVGRLRRGFTGIGGVVQPSVGGYLYPIIAGTKYFSLWENDGMKWVFSAWWVGSPWGMGWREPLLLKVERVQWGGSGPGGSGCHQGHLYRKVFQAGPTRRRTRGRPKTGWRDYSFPMVRIIRCCYREVKSGALCVLLPPLPDLRLVEDDRRMIHK